MRQLRAVVSQQHTRELFTACCQQGEIRGGHRTEVRRVFDDGRPGHQIRQGHGKIPVVHGEVTVHESSQLPGLGCLVELRARSSSVRVKARGRRPGIKGAARMTPAAPLTRDLGDSARRARSSCRPRRSMSVTASSNSENVAGP